MNMTDFLHLPFVEVLKLLVKGSVENTSPRKKLLLQILIKSQHSQTVNRST